MKSYQLPAPLRFFIWTLVLQVLGFGIAVSLRDTLHYPLLLSLAHGIIAFLLARFLTLSFPWQVLNLLIPIALWLSFVVHLPSVILFLALLVTFLIYLPTFWTRVPFYPTSRPMYNAILKQLPADSDFSFIDLGCGFGTLLSFLSEQRPNAKFVGVEISPLPYLISKLRFMLKPKSKVGIYLRSFWDLDLSIYDYVYAFLAPGPMPRLWEKCSADMKTGSVLLINSFTIPAPYNKKIEIDDKRKTILYIYDIERS